MSGAICLGTTSEHARNGTGREGATNTNPALTETAYLKEASNGCRRQ